MTLAEPMKNKVQAQLVSASQQFEKRRQPGLHGTSISEDVMNEFDQTWNSFDGRIKLVPGKEMLSALNRELQSLYTCAVTPGAIVSAFKVSEVAQTLTDLLAKLDLLRSFEVDDDSRAAAPSHH